MIFDCHKRKLNKKAFYLDKDPIEISHEYIYTRIDSYSHRYFEPPSKTRRITCMTALMTTLRKKQKSYSCVGNSNPIHLRLWCFQLSHMAPKFEEQLRKLPLEGIREGHENAYNVSHVSLPAYRTSNHIIPAIELRGYQLSLSLEILDYVTFAPIMQLTMKPIRNIFPSLQP